MNETSYDARERWLKNRVVLPTTLSSKAIAERLMPKIRAQAFFSARVAEARIAEAIKEITDQYSMGEIEFAEARTALKRLAVGNNLDDGSGSLKNLGSLARIDLILQQNALMAAAVGQYEAGMDPDIKERFPCWRYIASTAVNPRDSHAKYSGMVFSKDDPIWHKIFPPWDFNCKCSVEDCDDEPIAPEQSKKLIPQGEVESGFAFDPAHAFEEFDGSGIVDPAMRVRTLDEIMDRLPESADYILEKNGDVYLDGKIFELEKEFDRQAGKNIFPDQPKEFLKGEDFDYAQTLARQAVSIDAMQEINNWVNENGKDKLNPFMHYSSRPEYGENSALRGATTADGNIKWDEISDQRKKQINALQKLLFDMPKYKGTLFRGCTFESQEEADRYFESLMDTPEALTGFVSTTPNPAIAHHYAKQGKIKMILVVPNSCNAVYFGPYSTHPEDQETLLDYDFYLKGLTYCKKGDIVYILAKECKRNDRARTN